MNKAVNKTGSTRQDEQNTLATQTGEDKDFIHMREGNTGGNNQESGMTSDQGHKRKGKWPETRGELPFKIKHEIHKTKNQDRTSLTAVWHPLLKIKKSPTD